MYAQSATPRRAGAARGGVLRSPQHCPELEQRLPAAGRGLERAAVHREQRIHRLRRRGRRDGAREQRHQVGGVRVRAAAPARARSGPSAGRARLAVSPVTTSRSTSSVAGPLGRACHPFEPFGRLVRPGAVLLRPAGGRPRRSPAALPACSAAAPSLAQTVADGSAPRRDPILGERFGVAGLRRRPDRRGTHARRARRIRRAPRPPPARARRRRPRVSRAGASQHRQVGLDPRVLGSARET